MAVNLSVVNRSLLQITVESYATTNLSFFVSSRLSTRASLEINGNSRDSHHVISNREILSLVSKIIDIPSIFINKKITLKSRTVLKKIIVYSGL